MFLLYSHESVDLKIIFDSRHVVYHQSLKLNLNRKTDRRLVTNLSDQ